MFDKRLIIILALVVPLDGFPAHLISVDVDSELLNKFTDAFLCVTHHILALR